MVFATGDTHGEFDRIAEFCDRFEASKNDTMVILGDHGLNYFGEKKSRRFKSLVSRLPLTFVLLRGNHDRRVTMETHHLQAVSTHEVSGVFMVEDEFPDLLHLVDGNSYRLGDSLCFAMGGAFSVDGNRRRAMYKLGYHDHLWFPDEQLSVDELMQCHHTLSVLKAEAAKPVTILAHTCPQRFCPQEAFLSGINQFEVDRTMEQHFDSMFDLLSPEDRWLCGHWHIDKTDGSVRFLQNDIVQL